MKVIVAGSRTIWEIKHVEDAILESNFEVTEVVSGGARGVDMLGARWAIARNIPVKYFPADWKDLGRSAGYIRNQEMAAYADALIAVWDGVNKGTAHMIEIMVKEKKPYFMFRIVEERG